MAYRAEFLRALSLIAQAATEARAAGGGSAILVGGAAVEFFSGGAVTSGDFDIWTTSEAMLREKLLAAGFKDEDRHGRLLRGFYHPEFDFGVELVSGRLFDGRSDRTKLVTLMIGGFSITIAPVEDLIADRMGQYNSTPGKVPAMLRQAVILYLLAETIDDTYLDRRIREDTAGDFDLSDLEAAADDYAKRHD